MNDNLTQTLARYLEAIYRIQDEKGVARVRDIAQTLGVHKSTVTSALHSLAERDLVNYEPYEAATLTEEGHAEGRRLDDRHRVISRFLHRVLNVDEQTADRSACSLEHAMDEDVLERIVCFLAFIEHCPRGDSRWIEDFRCFSEKTGRGRSCDEWVRNYLENAGRALTTEGAEGTEDGKSSLTQIRADYTDTATARAGGVGRTGQDGRGRGR
jgi:DtxR family Mn-dependent transcriptional regulator